MVPRSAGGRTSRERRTDPAARVNGHRVCQKIKYDSMVDALLALKALEIRAAGVEAPVPVRIYRCKAPCWRWHVTSRPRW